MSLQETIHVLISITEEIRKALDNIDFSAVCGTYQNKVGIKFWNLNSRWR